MIINWNGQPYYGGYICPVCNPPTWGYFTVTSTGSSLADVKFAPACTHCYCRNADIDGRAHLVCCNCGHKKVCEI